MRRAVLHERRAAGREAPRGRPTGIAQAGLRPLLLAICAVGALVAVPSPAAATHTGDVDCADFATQAAAQSHLLAHPGDPDGLDGDHDGVACQSLPCPCGAATGGVVPPPPPAAVPPPAPASSAAAVSAKARVVRVIDGDTIKVKLATGQTVTVRLIGIDTPETVKPGTAVECGGRSATARMKQLALRNGVGRSVTLTSDPTQDAADRYGRVLAYVKGGGADFGRTMVSSGWAKTYVYERDFGRVVAYRKAQSSARRARPGRGVWRACGGDFHRAR
jgi:endonuclease YncB( thermonuclease family)